MFLEKDTRIEKSHMLIKVIIVVLLLLLWKFKMFLLILMPGYLDIIIQKHRLMIALKAKFYAFCYKTNSYLMFINFTLNMISGKLDTCLKETEGEIIGVDQKIG